MDEQTVIYIFIYINYIYYICIILLYKIIYIDINIIQPWGKKKKFCHL